MCRSSLGFKTGSRNKAPNGAVRTVASDLGFLGGWCAVLPMACVMVCDVHVCVLCMLASVVCVCVCVCVCVLMFVCMCCLIFLVS